QAVGPDAKQMLGRVPSYIDEILHVMAGATDDFNVTEKLFKEIICLLRPGRIVETSARVIHCVPSGSEEIEISTSRQSVVGAGATQGYRTEEHMAAGIGAGLAVSDASGSMVVDIGGGTTEVAIISLGGMVYKGSVRVGGDKFDEAIINYIRRNYGMLIGEP